MLGATSAASRRWPDEVVVPDDVVPDDVVADDVVADDVVPDDVVVSAPDVVVGVLDDPDDVVGASELCVVGASVVCVVGASELCVLGASVVWGASV